MRGVRVLGVLGVVAALLPAAAADARRAVPASRYAFAGGCFAVRGEGTPLFFKATGLGTYLLQDPSGDLLALDRGARLTTSRVAGPDAEWAARRVRGGRYLLRSTSQPRWLVLKPDGALAARPEAGSLRFARASGCRAFPEAETGATGRPFRGRNADGTVFGFADAHLHLVADLRAGGRVVHGETFDRFGIAHALGGDADDHGRDGRLDVTGNLLRTGVPVGTHRTDGWPTFSGWPTYDTYTHQQTYYVWLERMWMAGLRLVTAQLVEDQPLCRIEPIRAHDCDETATVALEAGRLRALQDYVDAQSGGPGRGWLRIVYDPAQARSVIRDGKLAVLMGVEASDPFDCSEQLEQPRCDRAAVDRGIAQYRQLGIRAMFITHWVDNAFAGAALESGAKGTFIGAMQITQTGLPFLTAPCPEPEQGSSCNGAGLTPLGRYLVERLMDAHMLIEADHLSERARLDVLALAEQRGYPLVSSHTDTGGFWTPSDLRRLYALGGFATARPDTAARLAQGILRFRADAPQGMLLGVGLGTDTGGFSALPEPDPSAPLTYPFRSVDGRVTFERERTGERVYDLNRDGVAHYGLFADLLAAMRRQPGGEEATALLFHSAEAYLRTWERALAR